MAEFTRVDIEQVMDDKFAAWRKGIRNDMSEMITTMVPPMIIQSVTQVITTIVPDMINKAIDERVPPMIEKGVKLGINRSVPSMIEAGIKKLVPPMIEAGNRQVTIDLVEVIKDTHQTAGDLFAQRDRRINDHERRLRRLERKID